MSIAVLVSRKLLLKLLGAATRIGIGGVAIGSLAVGLLFRKKAKNLKAP
jgi:hypothetical protein